MNKAIGYIRISTKDQSNFSLDGQERYIRDFGDRNGYDIVAIFRDDGQSAKNFDRPDWKKVESFCRQNHKMVDALIVAKYDRFSRNLKDSLGMIETLEEKFGIRVLSAMEPIMLNPQSPYFFQFRTQMLMGAQVEWLVIKDRTGFGMYNGAKAGRYFSRAPFGYVNRRDNQNKSIILVNEAQAPVVRRMFTMLLQGASLKEIGRFAAKAGYGNRGHSAVRNTLQNPVYAGLIRVPAYGDDAGGWFANGIHQPIVSTAVWYQAQDVLNPRKISRTVVNEEVPLRAILKCFCGRCMTAGKSKGKKRYYWYYRCDNHTGINLNAAKLHDQLEGLIGELSLQPYQIQYLKEKIRQQLQVATQDRDQVVQEKHRELAGLKLKLDSVEEKFITDQLDAEAYKKWKQRYSSEIAAIQHHITNVLQPVNSVLFDCEKQISNLSNLSWFWQKADLHGKQSILRQVFKSSLYYQDGVYRTPYILPVFQSKSLILKEKRLLEIEKPSLNSTESQYCAPGGT